MFKKIRSIKLPYRRQGLIYFTCRDYENQPPKVKDKINRMCYEIGGELNAVLFEIMTGEMSVKEAAIKYYINEKALYRMRKKFYESW